MVGALEKSQGNVISEVFQKEEALNEYSSSVLKQRYNICSYSIYLFNNLVHFPLYILYECW